jgi:hypothetical protein
VVDDPVDVGPVAGDEISHLEEAVAVRIGEAAPGGRRSAPVKRNRVRQTEGGEEGFLRPDLQLLDPA